MLSPPTRDTCHLIWYIKKYESHVPMGIPFLIPRKWFGMRGGPSLRLHYRPNAWGTVHAPWSHGFGCIDRIRTCFRGRDGTVFVA